MNDDQHFHLLDTHVDFHIFLLMLIHKILHFNYRFYDMNTVQAFYCLHHVYYCFMEQTIDVLKHMQVTDTFLSPFISTTN